MPSASSAGWTRSSSGSAHWRRADPLNGSVITGGYYRAVPPTELQIPKTRAPVPERAPQGETGRDDYVTVIRPSTSWPRIDFSELWRYRELLGIFIWRDLKVRYKQTAIGAGWAVFQPLFTAVVYSLIFGRFAKFPSGSLPYPIFAFAGILAWQYFSGALNVASGSLVSNVALVTKVYFPRLLLPLAGVHVTTSVAPSTRSLAVVVKVATAPAALVACFAGLMAAWRLTQHGCGWCCEMT